MGTCQTASFSPKKQPAAQGGPRKVSTSEDIEDEFGYEGNTIEQKYIKDALASRGIR